MTASTASLPTRRYSIKHRDFSSGKLTTTPHSLTLVGDCRLFVDHTEIKEYAWGWNGLNKHELWWMSAESSGHITFLPMKDSNKNHALGSMMVNGSLYSVALTDDYSTYNCSMSSSAGAYFVQGQGPVWDTSSPAWKDPAGWVDCLNWGFEMVQTVPDSWEPVIYFSDTQTGNTWGPLTGDGSGNFDFSVFSDGEARFTTGWETPTDDDRIALLGPAAKNIVTVFPFDFKMQFDFLFSSFSGAMMVTGFPNPVVYGVQGVAAEFSVVGFYSVISSLLD